MKKRLIKHVLKSISWICLIFFLILFARIFLFAAYHIPTSSMSPTILPGDYVFVNKMIPGIRISEKLFSFNVNNEKSTEYTRIKGIRILKRNDVIVFNYPYSQTGQLGFDSDLLYAKRCIAIPGDTFSIENGYFRVNNSGENIGYVDNQKTLFETSDKAVEATLNTGNIYPSDTLFKWNIKDFGPLYIPQKNCKISIDRKAAILYKNLIEYETRKHAVINGEQLSINDSIIKEYTFSKNYYFVAGDNVFASKDSRYWGLLPEDHIIGKIEYVLYSRNTHTEKLRWDRIFKRVN